MCIGTPAGYNGMPPLIAASVHQGTHISPYTFFENRAQAGFVHRIFSVRLDFGNEGGLRLRLRVIGNLWGKLADEELLE
jgi:hypothetical protein